MLGTYSLVDAISLIILRDQKWEINDPVAVGHLALHVLLKKKKDLSITCTVKVGDFQTMLQTCFTHNMKSLSVFLVFIAAEFLHGCLS